MVTYEMIQLAYIPNVRKSGEFSNRWITMNFDSKSITFWTKTTFFEHWQHHISVLTKNLEKSPVTPAFLNSINIPMPTFSGCSQEDVNEFLVRFNRIASFCGRDEERKLNLLPLLLRGSALVWFTSSTHTPERTTSPTLMCTGNKKKILLRSRRSLPV